MKNVAIIPARGGNKCTSCKYIKDFCGKPVISYSIEVAKVSGLFDRIIVSTDDEEIAEVSKKYGAEIPFMRPEELADDYTAPNAVVKHALEWLVGQGEIIEYACCIHASAPLIQVGHLKESYEKLLSSGKNYVFTVTSFEFPIQRALGLNNNGELEPFFPEHILSRSQDLEDAYRDAGQFCWGKAEAYLQDLCSFDSGAFPFHLPRYIVQEMDTIDDWQIAELMYAISHFKKINDTRKRHSC